MKEKELEGNSQCKEQKASKNYEIFSTIGEDIEPMKRPRY